MLPRSGTLLLLAALLLPKSAFAVGANWPLSDSPRFWILGEGLGHLSVDGYYFSTRDNYDNDGYVSTPAALGKMHYTNLRVHGAFGFAPRLSLFAQADFRALLLSNADAVSATAPYANNRGFGDAFVGFRWLLWRSSPTDRVYPTEWSPASFVTVLEGTWNFPMYDSAAAGTVPLGEQSNDFSAIARLAWYANEWLAFSGGPGYTHRTAGYAAVLPWSIRADVSLQERYKFRFWTDLSSIERLTKGNTNLNSSQPDLFPNGSFLFKSYSPALRTATLGAGYLLSRRWEAVGGFFFTATGVNAAKGWGAGLGFAYRPYQVPEIKYEEFRKLQIERLQTERRELRRREVVKYGFRATIVKVSNYGNYVKIFFGERDRVRPGDTFYVMPPDTQDSIGRRPVAFATVVQVQPDAAFLHIDERYFANVEIREGFEVRRVYFDHDEE